MIQKQFPGNLFKFSPSIKLSIRIFSCLSAFFPVQTFGRTVLQNLEPKIHIIFTEQLWQIVVDVLVDLADLCKIETELVLKLLFTENEILVNGSKLENFIAAG